ncbi:MAG: hypothetical protein Q8O86_13090 [Dehalococcoidia bacterium]|nr:hypothetical protein [Dehalococcoidia bacterium]
MRLPVSKEIMISILVVGFIAAMVALAGPTPTSALPDYTAKTGQACGVCHVNPAGGGALTPRGQAFAAIATHATDPAGAFTQSGAAAQPTATAAAPAASPTAAAKPAASPTTAPAASPTAAAKPAASPTAAAAPGALPRTGGFPVAPLAAGGGTFLAALGWSLRRLLKR